MMKLIIILCTALCTLLFFIAAFEHEPQAVSSTPRVSADDVKREIGEALDVTTEYLVQQSEEYRREFAYQLRELDTVLAAQLVKLESQLEEWQPEFEKAKAKLEEEMAALQEQRVLIQQKLAELKKPTGKALKDVYAGLSAAAHDLLQAAGNAIGRFAE